MSPDTIATIISVSIVVLAIAIIVTVIVSKIRHLILLSGEMLGSVFCNSRIHTYGKPK